jgi:heterodisulfide reductase subunit A
MKKALVLCTCGHAQDQILGFKEIKEKLSESCQVLEFDSLCLKPTIKEAAQQIKDKKFDAVVFGACTPKTIDTSIKEELSEIPYEIVALKEHVALPHADDPEGAAKKALNLLKMNLETVDSKQKIETLEIPVTNKTLIIGGGIAGLNSAQVLSDSDIEIFLVEKEGKLGGMLNNLHDLFPRSVSASKLIEEKIKTLKNKPNVSIILNTKIAEISGHPGNYKVDLITPNQNISIQVGAIIIASGIKEIGPNETKLYKNLPDVINQTDLAKMLKDGKVIKPSTSQTPKNVLMINCVGSRETEHPNCSVICCSISIKHALALTDLGIPTTIAYKDIRAPYDVEILYQKARTNGVFFIHGVPGSIESDENSRLLVNVEDALLGSTMELEPDLIVISGRLDPQDPSLSVLENVRVKTKDSGFLDNLYSKLATNETKEKGIFLAGSAFNPMNVDDTIISSTSAALKALKFLKGETFSKLMNVPLIDEDACEGCLTCQEICPYGAITIVDEKAKVEPILCTGCGACSVFCPVRAIELKNYSYSSLSNKIEKLLEAIKEIGQTKPIILGLVCQECAFCSLDVAGMTGYKYPSNVYFIDVPCTGRIGIIELLQALANGADAVIVAACPEQSCHYQKGSRNAKNLVKLTNTILKEIGYPEDLVFFDTLVSNEPEKLVKLIDMVNSKFKPMEKEIKS